MMTPVSLTVLLMLAAPPPLAPDEGSAAIAAVAGEEVAVVVAFDLARADPPTLARAVLGTLADEPDVRGMTQAAGRWVEALQKAGARELDILFDAEDMPGLPVAVVPLPEGADGKAIAGILSGSVPGVPLRWPATETMRGVVVAGTPEALARIRKAGPAARPELTAALAAGDRAAVRLAIVPSDVQRRAIEEALATLPAELGGGPVTILTRDLRWLALTLAVEPRPRLRAVVQARDEAAAEAIQKRIKTAIELLARLADPEPAAAQALQSVRQIEPRVEGVRITFELDPEKITELVSLPFRESREAARRAQCVNNLKQIGLALHNYHDAHQHFPAAYSASKEGKPLLSWRVQILPFLEQQPLYSEFHLDEPWDSPHNKELIRRMPRVYACPSGSAALSREGKTTYLAPRGPATIFSGPDGIKIQEISDGTSNTVFVVDASEDLATFWTRPDDWETGPEPLMKVLMGHHPGGVNVLFADGSVRFLRGSVMSAVLKALTTRNGKEVLGPNDF